MATVGHWSSVLLGSLGDGVDMPQRGEGAGYLRAPVPEKTLGQRKAGGGPWHAGR